MGVRAPLTAPTEADPRSLPQPPPPLTAALAVGSLHPVQGGRVAGGSCSQKALEAPKPHPGLHHAHTLFISMWCVVHSSGDIIVRIAAHTPANSAPKGSHFHEPWGMAGGAGLSWGRCPAVSIHTWPSPSLGPPESPEVGIGAGGPTARCGADWGQSPWPGAAVVPWGCSTCLGPVGPSGGVARESKVQRRSLGPSPRCLAGMVTEDVTCSFQPLVKQPCSQAHVPAGHRSADPRQELPICWSLQPSVHSVQTHPPLGLCSQHTLAGPPPLPDCSPCPPTAVPAPSSSPWAIWAHCVLPVSFPLRPPGMEPEALVTTRDRSRGDMDLAGQRCLRVMGVARRTQPSPDGVLCPS